MLIKIICNIFSFFSHFYIYQKLIYIQKLIKILDDKKLFYNFYVKTLNLKLKLFLLNS